MGERGPDRSNVSPIRAEVGHKPAPARSRRARPNPPIAPEWLDAYAHRVWKRVVRELEPLGVLNPSQREVLAAYCGVASVYHNAYRDMVANKRRGPDVTIAGSNRADGRVRNPSWSTMRESARLLAEMSKILLLNPASLMRAELPDYETGDVSDLD